MSRGGQVELDFWRMERDQSYFKSRQRELLEPRTFVRGVRSSSETFAGSGPGIGGFHENWNRFFQSDHRSAFRSVPFHDNRSTLYSPLPLPLPLHNNQNLRGAAAEGSPDASTSRSGGAAENLNSPGTSTAPLTIFYKGTVSIFDVPSDKAALIMKLAEQGNLEKFVPAVHHHHGFQFYSLLSEELPLARKRSLKRFLERRKERLKSVWPYGPEFKGHKKSQREAKRY
ncbi:hypothetical protein Sjap_016619 [Stephania japonica]|uniref:Protein TIFY n=1 Tax=Stephania japonica TaxID=461633 RepID=A0AAP0ILN0_9MAGN